MLVSVIIPTHNRPGLRMALKYPIAFLDEKLIVKRGGHADQLSKKYWGMDRFRIQSLEKLLNNRLSEDQRIGVEAELGIKQKIYQDGALKRLKSST